MIDSAIAIAIFLIIIFIFLKIKRKKLSSEPEKPVTQESKPTNTVASPALQAKETPESIATVQQEKTVITPAEPKNSPAVTQIPQSAKVITCSVPVYENKNVPQDSMLRRHYITHLRTMITELNQTCPTDFMLRRHYHAYLATQVDQCLNDEQATQQLIRCYENYKKTLACSAQKPQAIVSSSSDSKSACEAAAPAVPCNVSKIPEDSMLRRHYLASVYAQISDNLPTRPTDSTLRRHYDTMLENEVKKRLYS